MMNCKDAAEKIRLVRIQIEKDKDIAKGLEALSQIESAFKHLSEKVDKLETVTAVLKSEHSKVCEKISQSGIKFGKELAGLRTENDRLTAAYNETVKIVQKNDERLKALEDKYDPLG